MHETVARLAQRFQVLPRVDRHMCECRVQNNHNNNHNNNNAIWGYDTHNHTHTTTHNTQQQQQQSVAILAQVVDIRRGFLRLGALSSAIWSKRTRFIPISQSLCNIEQWHFLLLFPVRCGPLRLEAQTGLMKGDYSIIDYSMQCGSFDVGVSVCRVPVSFVWSCPLR